MIGPGRLYKVRAMPIGSTVRSRTYFDSVVLMRVASEIGAQPGVRLASLVMGTPANKEVLAAAGLLDETARAAGPNDLVIALDADAGVLAAALASVDEVLAQRAGGRRSADGLSGEDRQPLRPRALSRAAAGSNLAMISTPGPYAANEALKALRLGLHVFLFSDNVTIEDEIMLKDEAERRGLLVMGPDCGTAVIGGVPLGFANEVRRGSVGLAGASGTGLQQVASLLDTWGGGVSHILGVGSRDLSAEIGGRSMGRALEALAADASTGVIVLVSKPPAKDVARRLLEQAASTGKPVVACFIGSELASPGPSVEVVATLEDAARCALQLSGGSSGPTWDEGLAASGAPRTHAPRRHLRALYSGGTFAYETAWLFEARVGPLGHDVTPLVAGQPAYLPDEHVVVDLGADELTVGRPHPMIDPGARIAYLRTALADPSTAVVLLDVVIGHGAAADPAGALVPVIEQERVEHGPVVIAFVVGTEGDPQRRSSQEELLERAGVMLAPSSTAGALLAIRVLGAKEARR